MLDLIGAGTEQLTVKCKRTPFLRLMQKMEGFKHVKLWGYSRKGNPVYRALTIAGSEFLLDVSFFDDGHIYFETLAERWDECRPATITQLDEAADCYRREGVETIRRNKYPEYPDMEQRFAEYGNMLIQFADSI